MSGITQEVRKLENDVPVLMSKYPDSRSVTIGVAFNVGGRNEFGRSASHDGISHFLEHQFFKGNDNLSPNDVHIAIDELAGMTNAFTAKAVTCYFTKSLSSEMDQAIELWSELLTYGEISQEEFDKESHVVRQEFRRGEDNAIQYLFRNLGSELHRGTSLEMDVIGSEESLSSVTLEEMEKYREEHYDLSNAALMILGNIEFDTVEKKLNETFGQREVSDTKPSYELTEYTVPEETEINVFRYDKTSPLGLFGIGIKTPGGQSDDAPVLELINSYLSKGNSSLMQERLVRPGLAAIQFSDIRFFEDVGQMVIILGAPPPKLEEAHMAVMNLLHHILTCDVDEELLDNLCNQIEYDMRRTREEPIRVLIENANNYWSRGKFMSLDEVMQELRAVTPEDFDRVRKKILGNLNGVYLMAGTLGDFHPTFPEGTWEGKFE